MNFSVMMPCHNVKPEWAYQAVHSVLPQLVDGDELVVVHDGVNPITVAWDAKFADMVRIVRIEDRGGVAAHNACIEHAEKELVHILHPDDWVLQGFYDAIRGAVTAAPGQSLYCTGTLWCDGTGVPFAAPRPDMPSALKDLHTGNPLCVAACVVPKASYEKYGGWCDELLHTADWECWYRLAHYGICYYQWPMACYRVSSDNHTAKLKRTGENLRDYMRLLDVVSRYSDVDEEARREFKRMVLDRARSQARNQPHGEAADANRQLVQQIEASL